MNCDQEVQVIMLVGCVMMLTQISVRNLFRSLVKAILIFSFCCVVSIIFYMMHAPRELDLNKYYINPKTGLYGIRP
jgi:hypothetical protein